MKISDWICPACNKVFWVNENEVPIQCPFCEKGTRGRTHNWLTKSFAQTLASKPRKRRME